MRATALVTLRVTNSWPRRSDSWLKRMPAAGEQPVGLAVVDGDLVAEDLGHAVGRAGVEGGELVLRRLPDLAEHLRRRGLVEAHRVGLRAPDHADGLQQPEHAGAGDVGRELGLLPRHGDERDPGQVVDLVGLGLLQRADQGRQVREVAGDELDEGQLGLDLHALGVVLALDQTEDLVALLVQQLGQELPVLAGDAGDQRATHRRGPFDVGEGSILPVVTRSARVTGRRAQRVRRGRVDRVGVDAVAGDGLRRRPRP